jgi:hypothetical protein
MERDFYIACENGNIDRVQTIINELGNQDLINQYINYSISQKSSLIIACLNNRLNIVEYLLNLRPRITDDLTLFKILRTVRDDHLIKIIELLLKKGINVKIMDIGIMLLADLYRFNCYKTIKLLLENINQDDPDNYITDYNKSLINSSLGNIFNFEVSDRASNLKYSKLFFKYALNYIDINLYNNHYDNGIRTKNFILLYVFYKKINAERINDDIIREFLRKYNHGTSIQAVMRGNLPNVRHQSVNEEEINDNVIEIKERVEEAYRTRTRIPYLLYSNISALKQSKNQQYPTNMLELFTIRSNNQTNIRHYWLRHILTFSDSDINFPDDLLF